MFFFLSKTLFYLAMPAIWLSILLLYAIFGKREHLKKWSLWGVGILFFIFTNPLLTAESFRLWEGRPTPIEQLDSDYDIAIVLAGVINMSIEPEDRVYFQKGADRVTHALQLYKMGKVKKILLSGGSGALMGPASEKQEAVKLAQFLEMAGVPKEDLIIEPTSHNTHKNAEESAKIIKSQYPNAKLLLITSAFHMRRAKGCFEKQGLKVDTFSADFHTSDRRITPKHLIIPSLVCMPSWHILFHEMLGVVAYKVKGYM